MSPETQQGKQPEISPKMQKEVDAYITGLSKLLHSKNTSGQVVELLKAGPPEETVPSTALLVNKQMEQSIRAKGKKPSLDVLVNAGAFLVGDLLEIGNAAGIFQINSEEQVAPILQSTLQTYIENGLADGSVDPVELQQKVEPLLTDGQRSLGMEAAGMSGIPEAPNELTAMQAYGAKERRAGALQGKGGNV